MAFPYIQAVREAARKTLEKKIIFQIGTINPQGITECFSFN